MTSMTRKYRSLGTFDKVLIPGLVLAFVGTAAIFANTGVHALVIIAGLAGFFLFLHFILSSPKNVTILVTMIVQVLIMYPIGNFYGTLSYDQTGDLNDGMLGLVYVIAATYLTAWAVFQFASGHLWVKLILGFLVIDVVAPLLSLPFPTGKFLASCLLGALLVTVVCLPWYKLQKKDQSQIHLAVKDDKITSATKSLLNQIEGVKVADAGQSEITDFIVSVDKKHQYAVTVLGKKREVRFDELGGVFYGSENIKALLHQVALEAKAYRAIPVLVNSSETPGTFAEILVERKAEGRRRLPVIMTTPFVLLDILAKKQEELLALKK